MLNSRNKKVKFITISSTREIKKLKEGEVPPILTIVTSMKEAEEWIDRSLVCLHYNHYSEWCKLQGNLDPDSYDTVKMYCGICVKDSEYDKFSISSFTITRDKLASILRMFNKSIPNGSSFETDAEFELFAHETADLLDKIKKK